MATTDSIKALLQQHDFHRALIIDDAFDRQPQYETLIVAEPNLVGNEIEKLPPEAKARLAAVLKAEDLSEDDWETGLATTSFLAELWKLKGEGVLPKEVDEPVFATHAAETQQKLDQLAPLQVMLKDTLQLKVQELGRDGRELPENTKVVFLDLFLGVTRQDKAREEAAQTIKQLLKGMPDRERPVVVLMSTETGEELETWAEDLRKRASLLGAKFRVISKTEFQQEGPLLDVLEDLLAPLDQAQALASLLDQWDSALTSLRQDVMEDLRKLDLADCAYLQRFRLEAEGMPLGMYLLEAYGDILKYRLEGCRPLLDAAGVVDGLSFENLPPAHFLPNEGVNWLTHAMSFVNEAAIRQRGYQFAGASKRLELGDVIVAKPADWVEGGKLQLTDGTAVFAVISQACDLQQDKSDAVLLLKGALRARSWDDSIRPDDTRVDCFTFRERDYVIEWHKAKLDAWSKQVTDRRLKPESTHLRIARLRNLPALKAQQIFASNLTRVGTLANPHMVVPVGIKVVAKDAAGEAKILIKMAASERFGCLVKGMVLEGKGTAEKEYLIFKRSFGARLSKALLGSLEEFNPHVRPFVEEFAKSQVALSQFRAPCRVGQDIKLGQLKIDLRRGDPANGFKQNLTIVAEAPSSVVAV